MQAFLITNTNKYKLQKENIIGRHPKNNIVIDHPSVSKQHALIKSTPLGWELTDLDSLNGNTINASKLLKGQTKILQNNDSLQFGKRTNHQSDDQIFKLKTTFPKKLIHQKSLSLNDIQKIQQKKMQHDLKTIDPQINLRKIQFKHSQPQRPEPKYFEPKPIRKEQVDFANTNNQSHQSAIQKNFYYLNKQQKINQLQQIQKKQLQRINQIRRNCEQYEKQLKKQRDLCFNQLQKRRLQIQDKQKMLYTKQRQNEQKVTIKEQKQDIQSKLQREQIQAKRRQNQLKIMKQIKQLQNQNENILNRIEHSKKIKQTLSNQSAQIQHKIQEQSMVLQKHQYQNKVLILYAAQLQKSYKKMQSQLPRQIEKQNHHLKSFNALANKLAHARHLLNQDKQQILKTPGLRRQIQILQQLINEKITIKKHLIQWNQRQNGINKKWLQDLRMNDNKVNRIQALLVQLKKNLVSIDGICRQNNRKLQQASMKFLPFLTNQQYQQASEYLVVQLKQLNNQKKQIITQNEQLHLNIQQIIYQIERFKSLNQRQLKLIQTQQQDMITNLKSKLLSVYYNAQELSKKGIFLLLEQISYYYSLCDSIIILQRSIIERKKRIESIKNQVHRKQTAHKQKEIIEKFAQKLLTADKQIQDSQITNKMLKQQKQKVKKRNLQKQQQLKQLQSLYEHYKQAQIKKVQMQIL